MAKRKVRVRVRFAWYDLWIGAYWDRSQSILYICPIPTLLIAIGRLPKETGLAPLSCLTVWMRDAVGGPRPWVCTGGMEGDGHQCLTFAEARTAPTGFNEAVRRVSS